MKRLTLYTAIILATLLGLVILWQFRLVLLLFILSLFTAATIRPFVKWLTARGFSPTAAQVLLYAMVFFGVGIFLLLAGDLFLLELNGVANRLVIEYEALHNRWQVGPAWQQSAVSLLPPPLMSDAEQNSELEEMLPVVLNVTRVVSNFAGGLLLVLVLSTYWSADQHRFERLWLSLLPAKRRAYARDTWRQIETAVGNYVRSQTIQSVLAALLLGIGAALIGLTAPLVLALVGALTAFVPLFGGLLATVLAFGLGSLESSGLGFGVGLYTLAVFLVLELLVEPRLWPLERRSFLLTIVVLIPLFEAFGMWGLLLAPPLAAALEVLIGQVYQAAINRSKKAVALADLEARYQQMLQKSTEAEYGDVTPELRSLAVRLSQLLAESRVTIRN